MKKVGTAEITPTSMANGAKSLLDEVARNKVTGEEERYSHTDLVDFKANLEGARKSYDQVSEAKRKELSDGVNALAEPLSKLAAAVAK